MVKLRLYYYLYMYPYQLLSIYQSSIQAAAAKQDSYWATAPAHYLPKLGSSSVVTASAEYGLRNTNYVQIQVYTSYLYEPVQVYGVPYHRGNDCIGECARICRLHMYPYVLRTYVLVLEIMPATTHVCPTSKVP